MRADSIKGLATAAEVTARRVANRRRGTDLPLSAVPENDAGDASGPLVADR